MTTMTGRLGRWPTPSNFEVMNFENWRQNYTKALKHWKNMQKLTFLFDFLSCRPSLNILVTVCRRIPPVHQFVNLLELYSIIKKIVFKKLDAKNGR